MWLFPFLLGLGASLAPEPQEVTATWSAEPPAPYAGQSFQLLLTLSYDGSWAADSLVQLFPQGLDVPLQVTGFEGLPVAISLLESPPAGPDSALTVGSPTRTLAVDGQLGRGSFIPGDTESLRIQRTARVDRAQSVSLPPPEVRYAVATAFRSDFVRGRVPVDMVERSALGSAFALEIRSLPEKSRPFEFDGAVGTFSLSVDASPKSLRVGDTLELKLTVSGAGELPSSVTPRLAENEAFRTLGVARSSEGTDSTFTFQLEARDIAATATPSVTLCAFDPSGDSGRYDTLTSGEIPIAVRPAVNGPANGSRPDSIASTPGAAQPGETSGDADPTTPAMPWTLGVLAFIGIAAVVSAFRRIMIRSAQRATQQDSYQEGSYPQLGDPEGPAPPR